MKKSRITWMAILLFANSASALSASLPHREFDHEGERSLQLAVFVMEVDAK